MISLRPSKYVASSQVKMALKMKISIVRSLGSCQTTIAAETAKLNLGEDADGYDDPLPSNVEADLGKGEVEKKTSNQTSHCFVHS